MALAGTGTAGITGGDGDAPPGALQSILWYQIIFVFYGRSFRLANPSCTTPGMCKFSGDHNKGPCTDTAGYLSYYEIPDPIGPPSSGGSSTARRDLGKSRWKPGRAASRWSGIETPLSSTSATRATRGSRSTTAAASSKRRGGPTACASQARSSGPRTWTTTSSGPTRGWSAGRCEAAKSREGKDATRTGRHPT
jgi:hypothetical protein